MSRLRHPIRSIREPFGKAGLTVAILALVFAMVGGAWAAVGLNGKQKKEVKAIAKSFQGTGPTGPAGANGTNGTNGKDGAGGKEGPEGKAGTDGADGKSVITTEIPEGEPGCESLGGTAVEVDGSGQVEEVCNGAEGPQGPGGSPWTAGGTLPPGATETGTWGYQGLVTIFKDGEGNLMFDGQGQPMVTEFHAVTVPISFPIPVKPAPANSKVIITSNTPDATHCPGSVAEPTAAEGYVCIYGNRTSASLSSINTPGTGGLLLELVPELDFGNLETTAFAAGGSWAVTGS